MTARRTESAITVVEVIIAALILVVVVGSLAMAVSGGTRLRGSARLQSSLTASGKQIQDDLSSNRRWMDAGGCLTVDVECDVKSYVSSESTAMPDVEGSVIVKSATATPLDSAVDGVGKDDSDGIVPDFFRIKVVIEPSPDVAARYSLDPVKAQRTFTTTIDRNGNRQVGSVAIEACRVVNQADERMELQGCRQSGRTHVDMRGCPPSPNLGCNAAWSWVAGDGTNDDTPANKSPYLSLERVDMSGWSLTLVDDSDPSKTYDMSKAKHVDGMIVFPNIPAGAYRLSGVPSKVGPKTERWGTKDLPSTHDGVAGSVVVDAGIQNHELVMYRAKRVGSIDLHFSRKIRTYHLGGPYWTGWQTNVAPRKATSGYQSSTAEEMCKIITDTGGVNASSAGAWNKCVDVQPHGANCADVFISGDIWQDTTRALATHVLMHEVGAVVNAVSLADAPDAPGDPVRWVKIRHALALRYCTWYAEYLNNKYYTTTDTTPPFVEIPGARFAVTYYSRPVPDARHLDFPGGTPTLKTPVCVTAERGQCTVPSGAGWAGAVSLKKGLVPGLSTDIMVPPADAADAAVNDHFSGPPAPLSSGAIWTKTNGEMVTPSGTYNGSQINVVGMGECYWTSVRFPGKAEGPCDPCKPMWTTTKQYDGCSVLVRTKWCRNAWESVEQFDWTGGVKWAGEPPYYYAIQGQCGSVGYAPPWRCSTVVPHVGHGATCSPQAVGGGGPKDVPSTKHHSPTSNGEGLQNGMNLANGDDA